MMDYGWQYCAKTVFWSKTKQQEIKKNKNNLQKYAMKFKWLHFIFSLIHKGGGIMTQTPT